MLLVLKMKKRTKPDNIKLACSCSSPPHVKITGLVLPKIKPPHNDQFYDFHNCGQIINGHKNRWILTIPQLIYPMLYST